MNDIYGNLRYHIFQDFFFIEGHQLSLLLVVPLQGAPLARAKRVTHGYVGLAFSHKPSHIFFDQIDEIKYRLRFQSMLLFDVEACWNHAWMMFDSFCLATFWTAFHTGSVASHDSGRSWGWVWIRCSSSSRHPAKFPAVSTCTQLSPLCKRFPDVSGDFFPQKNNKQHQWNHCSFLKVDFPAPRRRTSPGRLVDVCVVPFDFGWEEKAGNDILMMNSYHFRLGKRWEPKRSWLRLWEGIFVKTDSRPVGADPQICCQHTDSGLTKSSRWKHSHLSW